MKEREDGLAPSLFPHLGNGTFDPRLGLSHTRLRALVGGSAPGGGPAPAPVADLLTDAITAAAPDHFWPMKDDTDDHVGSMHFTTGLDNDEVRFPAQDQANEAGIEYSYDAAGPLRTDYDATLSAGSNDFTIMWTMRVRGRHNRDGGTYGAILSIDESGGSGDGWGVYHYQGDPAELRSWCSGFPRNSDCGRRLMDREWRHITYTRAGSTNYLYIDGEFIESWATNLSFTATPALSLGRFGNNTGTPGTGPIAHIAYWKTRALSANEIANIAAKHQTPTVAREEWEDALATLGATHLFRTDEASGGTLTNALSGDDGTIDNVLYSQTGPTLADGVKDAFEVDSDNVYGVTCPADFWQDDTNRGHTVVLWCKLTDNGGSGRDIMEYTDRRGIYKQWAASQFNAYIGTNDFGNSAFPHDDWPDYIIGDGQWHQLVITFDDLLRQGDIFIDGAIIDGGRDPIGYSQAGHFDAGETYDQTNDAGFFNDAGDQFSNLAFIPKALTKEEVEALYDGAVHGAETRPYVAASSSNTAASGTTITANVPGGLQQGDLIVVTISRDGEDSPTPDDDTWGGPFLYAHNGSGQQSVTSYSRIADGSEPASYTFTHVDKPWVAQCLLVRNAAYVGIVEAQADGSQTAGTVLTPDVGEDDTLLVHQYSGGDNAWPVSVSGLTPLEEDYQDMADGIGLTTWSEWADAGSPTAHTVDHDGDASAYSTPVVMQFGASAAAWPAVEATEFASSATDSVTTPAPPHEDGDLLLAIHITSNDGTSISREPGGWRILARGAFEAGNDNGVALYTRIADSEPADYTFETDIARDQSLHILTVTGVDENQPIDIAQGREDDATNRDPRLVRTDSVVPGLRLDVAVLSSPVVPLTGIVKPPMPWETEVVDLETQACVAAILTRIMPIGPYTTPEASASRTEVTFTGHTGVDDPGAMAIVLRPAGAQAVVIDEDFGDYTDGLLQDTLTQGDSVPSQPWVGSGLPDVSSGEVSVAGSTTRLIGLGGIGTHRRWVEADVRLDASGTNDRVGVWVGGSSGSDLTAKLVFRARSATGDVEFLFGGSVDKSSAQGITDGVEYTLRLEFDGEEAIGYLDGVEVLREDYSSLSDQQNANHRQVGFSSKSPNSKILAFRAGELDPPVLPVGASQLTWGTTETAIDMDVPVGIAGDSELVAMICRGVDDTMSAPAGWTKLGSEESGGGETLDIFTRSHDGSSLQYQFTQDSAKNWVGVIVALDSGVTVTLPEITYQGSQTSEDMPTPSVGTNPTRALYVRGTTHTGQPYSNGDWPDVKELEDDNSGGGSDRTGIGVWTELFTATGTPTARTMTNSTSARTIDAVLHVTE